MIRELVVLAIVACSLTACSSGSDSADDPTGPPGGPSAPPPSAPAVTNVAITPAEITLTGLNATATLTASVTTTQGVSTGTPVTWSSSSPTIASVQGTGQSASVTSVSIGTATITATAGTRSASATVSVVAPTRALTVSVAGTGRVVSAPAGIDCSGGANTGCSANFADGTTVSLAALPGTGQTLSAWGGACAGSSTCQITMSETRTVQATFSTLVIPVASVSVTPSVATIAPGTTANLTAVPRDAAGQPLTGRTVVWKSADPAIASVNQTGVATAVGVGGPVAITATVDGVSGTMQLTVKSPFITAVSLGTSLDLTCAAEATGEAWCWGSNDYGARGIGSLNTSSGISLVSSDQKFVTIDAGSRHACAATASGEVYCWGSNISGEIGDGSGVETRLLPVRVAQGIIARKTLTGYLRSCVLGEDRLVRCWGDNWMGMLGVGTSDANVVSPRTVSGGVQFREVVASKSAETVCGIDVSSRAWCWGNNRQGMLGDGTNVSRSSPVRVLGNFAFAQVAPGNDHSCAITTEGVAYCWGYQISGQLGNGLTNFQEQRSPVPVSTNLRFKSIAVGFRFSCGVTTSGQLHCWGDNTSGALADGTYTSRALPAPALTDVRFNSVVGGHGNACAIAESGTVYCWGLNRSGSVTGSGSTAVNVPSAIARP